MLSGTEEEQPENISASANRTAAGRNIFKPAASFPKTFHYNLILSFDTPGRNKRRII